MSIAITEDHRALADTASDFLLKHGARGAARALLEADAEALPAVLGRPAPSSAGSGCTCPRSTAGRASGFRSSSSSSRSSGRAVAPGPFVPTVIASAVIAAARRPTTAGAAAARARRRHDDRRGRARRRRSRSATARRTGRPASSSAAGSPTCFVVAVGDDVVIVERAGGGVEVEIPTNLDPTRRVGARHARRRAGRRSIPGARQLLVDLARLLFAAEATGIARECTELAAEYAKVREQFGRPIAMFQAVKHHCANMLVATELATARGVGRGPRPRRPAAISSRYTAAMAATLAIPAADLCAQPQHPGARRHRLHVGARRAPLPAARHRDRVASSTPRPRRSTSPTSRAAASRRERSVDLPPEAEAIRDDGARVRRRASSGLDADAAARGR